MASQQYPVNTEAVDPHELASAVAKAHGKKQMKQHQKVVAAAQSPQRSGNHPMQMAAKTCNAPGDPEDAGY